MTIEIQVQGGKVTITVGGQAISSADDGKAVQQGVVGGGALPDPGTGGGTPGGGACGGALVIGPIVLDCYCQGGSEGGKGGGATVDPGTGGEAPSSGVTVIGPIVVGGYRGGSGKPGVLPPSRPVDVDPDE